MKSILKLSIGIFSLAILCSSVSAKQLKCEYRVNDLEVSATLITGTTRNYSVDVSCNISCTHHGNSDNDSKTPFKENFSPVEVDNDGEKGKADAIVEGRWEASRNAWLKLLEECQEKLNCNCEDKGCLCDACVKPAPLPFAASLGSHIPTAKILIQDDVSINNPIVLKGIKSVNDIKEIMDYYIWKHHEDSNIAGYIRTMIDDRFIEIVHITYEKSSERHHKLVYFDMTSIYKKLRRTSNKETRRKVEQLMENHLPQQEENQPQ